VFAALAVMTQTVKCKSELNSPPLLLVGDDDTDPDGSVGASDLIRVCDLI